jgi:TonB-linked SusC/RagA family outer membrane protein
MNAYAEYAILPSLKLRVTGGVVDNQNRNEAFNNSRTQTGMPGSNDEINGSVSFPQSSSWLNENTLTWNKSLNNHSINVLGGFTAQGGKSSNFGMKANHLLNEELGISGLDEGLAQPLTASSSSWTLASFLGRVNYSYKSKYLLTASFRADGSSKFTEANHWSYFPSAALAWRFSSENFLKNSRILSDGKLRVGYGATGNNRVGDFSYLTTFGLPNAATYVFGNAYVNGIVPTNLGNSDLKWESTAQTDLGLDLDFLQQRISLSIDAYQKKTTDLLLNASLPNSTGFDKAFKNIGSVRNRGLEFTLSTVNVKKRDFSWSSSFNISFNQSKVLGLTENQEALQSAISWDGGWSGVSAYIAKLGMPLGLMYGYICDGVYSYNDFDKTVSGNYILKDNVTANGNTRDKIQPGDIKYRDLNGDLKVDAKDYTIIGRGAPIHYGGFTNNFMYKNFDLNVFFQWSYGNNILNANRLLFDGGRNMGMNQFASYANRWTPENSNSDRYRVKGYFGGGYSTYVVEDGSYLRLKTVSLGYNLDKRLLKKCKINGLRVYVAAQNLYTWTHYSGMDPEVSAYPSALTPGFDFSTYPRARTTTVGLNLTF